MQISSIRVGIGHKWLKEPQSCPSTEWTMEPCNPPLHKIKSQPHHKGGRGYGFGFWGGVRWRGSKM
eukprot:670807-Amphidinium_carterae.2